MKNIIVLFLTFIVLISAYAFEGDFEDIGEYDSGTSSDVDEGAGLEDAGESDISEEEIGEWSEWEAEWGRERAELISGGVPEEGISEWEGRWERSYQEQERQRELTQIEGAYSSVPGRANLVAGSSWSSTLADRLNPISDSLTELTPPGTPIEPTAQSSPRQQVAQSMDLLEALRGHPVQSLGKSGSPTTTSVPSSGTSASGTSSSPSQEPVGSIQTKSEEEYRARIEAAKERNRQIEEEERAEERRREELGFFGRFMEDVLGK